MLWLRRLLTMTLQVLFPGLSRQLARLYFRVSPSGGWFSVTQVLLGTTEHRRLRYTPTSAMELKGRILVYSILGCPHCMRAKNSLQEKRLPFTDVRLDVFPQCRPEVQSRTGSSTVPQIFFNAIHVGGNQELQKLISDDKEQFEELVKEVINNAPPDSAPVPPDPSTAVNDADPGEVVCEPDEYAELVHSLKDSGLIHDHRQGIKVHKNSFSGREFVDWVVKTKGLGRERAVEMGQQLIDRHFGHNVKTSGETFRDDKVYYRLLDDDDTQALNSGTMSKCEPRQATDLGSDMRKLILKLYSAFLSPDGKKVNYQGIGGSDEFQRYMGLTIELQRVQVVDCSREEKLAFFINIYNALVIHANIVRGPPTNLWQRYKFFNTVKYIIGGYAYSLQDIENGVLRANRKGVGMFTRPFSASDPRLKVALEQHEPLIHFGLVCGAKSCPPIKTYTAEGVYEELNLAAAAFLEGADGCQVDPSCKAVQLSQILKWYQPDLGANSEEVLQWVFQHMASGQKKSQLGELINGKKVKVSYMHYDWSINS